MSTFVEVNVSTQQGHQALDALEAHRKEVEDASNETIEEVEVASSASFNRVISMARGSYLVSLGMVKAMGGSVSYMFRSMVSAAFATIAALRAVSLGKAMTTRDWLSFVMEMGQLALATSATIAAELQQQQIGRDIMGAKLSLMGLQQLIGALSFF